MRNTLKMKFSIITVVKNDISKIGLRKNENYMKYFLIEMEKNIKLIKIFFK